MHSHILVDYCKGKSIKALAKKYNFPASLLARGVVENITIFQKKELTMAMRDPMKHLSSMDIIFDPFHSSEKVKHDLGKDLKDTFSGLQLECSEKSLRLAREVVEATNSDPLYGPRHDKERNYVGLEYEIILERALSAMSKFHL